MGSGGDNAGVPSAERGILDMQLWEIDGQLLLLSWGGSAWGGGYDCLFYWVDMDIGVGVL